MKEEKMTKELRVVTGANIAIAAILAPLMVTLIFSIFSLGETIGVIETKLAASEKIVDRQEIRIAENEVRMIAIEKENITAKAERVAIKGELTLSALKVELNAN